MSTKIVILIAAFAASALFSSCNMDVFSHSYLSGNVTQSYVDNDPSAPGISYDDGDSEDYGDDTPVEDVWGHSRYNFTWAGVWGLLFNN
jgi:hypothetical protein